MPTYEYACPTCKFRFERFQPISAARVKVCPKCGKTGVKRLIGGGGGLIFKGTGFYATDYRKKGHSGKEPGEGGGSGAAQPGGGCKNCPEKAKPAGNASA